MTKNADEKGISAQGNSIHQDTLNNFKNLKANLGSITAEKIIDYDLLYSSLIQKHQEPQPILNFTKFLQSKQEELKRANILTKEEQLTTKFQQNVLEIREKKKLVASVFLDNYNLNLRIKSNKQEVIDHTQTDHLKKIFIR